MEAASKFKEEYIMVVQHNLRAVNSNRMLGLTASTQSKSTEKLSSGYKINRAADDAAGLAISEKMRRQIRGLTQASTNAQDGVSMVQTAEGALNEVHDMLQRLNELAVKAANGTNQSEDCQYIDKEVQKLKEEITRTANDTKFNKIDLLSSAANGKEVALQVGTEAGQTIKITLQAMNATSIGVGSISMSTTATASSAIADIEKAIQSVSELRAELGATQNRLEHTINNQVRLCWHSPIRLTRVYFPYCSNRKAIVKIIRKGADESQPLFFILKPRWSLPRVRLEAAARQYGEVE